METLGKILGGKNYGLFRNSAGEYCQISRWYERNTLRIKVVFSKDMNTLATRYAINTISEKKVLKLIKDEGFVLV